MTHSIIRCTITSFLGLVLCGAGSSGMDIPDYFPSVRDDLTKVTWAHAVNSQALLRQALDGDVMMLEADVVMGTLQADSEGHVTSGRSPQGHEVEGSPHAPLPDSEGSAVRPVMAHPPNLTSDLSLEDFLGKVVAAGKRKGIKLDFKSTEVVGPSLQILKNFSESLNFPMMLNADILRGPVNNTGNPVNATYFLRACARDFPTSILSVGWTTTWGPEYTEGSYTRQQVQEMMDVLKSNNVTQAVTFPVRAGIAANSLVNLQNLLSSVVNSTLTVWSSATDHVDGEKLKHLITTIGVNRVYLDVPEALQRVLHNLGLH